MRYSKMCLQLALAPLLWQALVAKLVAQLRAQLKLPEQLALTVQSLAAELFPLRVPGHDFPQRLSNSLTKLPKVA